MNYYFKSLITNSVGTSRGLCHLNDPFMQVLSFVLTISLQQRTQLAGSAADNVLKLGLFYGIFLPLSEYCSVDAGVKMADAFCSTPTVTRRPAKAQEHFSAATVGLALQLMIIYFTTGSHKYFDPTWTESGDAAFNAMALPSIARPLARCLIASPELARALTYLTLMLELSVPVMWLLLSGLSDWIRVGLIAALAGMHVVCGVVWCGVACATTLALIQSKWLCNIRVREKQQQITKHENYTRVSSPSHWNGRSE